MTAPIKRHDSLQPFSRDHHHGLLLCWKIREGFKRNIAPERMKQYTDWFWNNHLQQHFEAEEQYIFPVLAPDDPLIVQALKEHKVLKHLFEHQENVAVTLSEIEKILNEHIRFEERILFKKIQETATFGQLKVIETHHSANSCDDWHDEFWTKEKGE